MVEFAVEEGGGWGGIFVFFGFHFGSGWCVGDDGLWFVYGFMVDGLIT